MNKDLDSLVSLPEAMRDEAWEIEFFQAICQSKVELVKDQPESGPDGWPYLLIKTGPSGAEPFTQLIRWASPKGIGLAVNTHKMLPDYVFTYGMVWHFLETGRFTSLDSGLPANGEVILGPGEQVLLGEPTEKYLPKYVRQVLRDFLKAQGFLQPKIVVMSSPDYKVVDLVFSMESLNSLEAKHHRTMAEALAWFLPLHYSLIFGSEHSLRGFVDL